MGDSESKSRSEATPLPIAYSRWPIAVLFPTTHLFTSTRFFMVAARTLIKALL
jgi:hypothetical protein